MLRMTATEVETGGAGQLLQAVQRKGIVLGAQLALQDRFEQLRLAGELRVERPGGKTSRLIKVSRPVLAKPWRFTSGAALLNSRARVACFCSGL